MSRSGIIALLLGVGACTEPEPPCGEQAGDLCRVAGTGELGFNMDGLAATESDLFLASAARRGPDGGLWIMDFNNQRLRRIGEDGSMGTVVGNGFHAFADTEVPLLDSPLENPIDFRFLADGRPVFVSYHDPRVLVVAHDGTLDAFAGAPDGTVGIVGNEGDGGPAEEALFIQLDGIAVGDDDVIYVSDSLAHRVRKIEDGMIDTVAGTGDADYSGDGGPGTEAALWWPTALELDPEGNLYIADTFNHAIRRLTPDGTISTIAGVGIEGYDGDGGPATEARFRGPLGLALASDGTLYIGDRGNFRVRRIDPDGTIDTIAGNGEQGMGHSGPALETKLGWVARVALDDDGLLIVDQENSMVFRLFL